MKCKNCSNEASRLRKHEGFCFDCWNVGVPELLERIAELESEFDVALSGDKSRMFDLYLRRVQRKHAQPGFALTWIQMQCQHCPAQMVFCIGDTNDLTANDVESVRCWKCGKVVNLQDELPSELVGERLTPEELDRWAVKSYPIPTTAQGKTLVGVHVNEPMACEGQP